MICGWVTPKTIGPQFFCFDDVLQPYCIARNREYVNASKSFSFQANRRHGSCEHFSLTHSQEIVPVASEYLTDSLFMYIQ